MKSVVLAVLLLLSSPANGAPPCQNLEAVKADVAEWQDDTRVTPIGADKTLAYFKALKRNPSFATLEGTTAAVVHSPTKPKILFVTFSAEGCALQTWPVRTELFAMLLGDRGI
jgi:hypothetical protein